MASHGGQSVLSCQMCEQSTQIKKKCIDCDYLLCTNCCQLHNKIKDLTDHQLIDLRDIGSIKDGNVAKLHFKNIKCQSHTEQICCLFCKDCDKVVCAICISEKHNQHKMIQINEGHKLNMEKIGTWRIDIKRKIQNVTTDLSTLDTKYSTENSKYSTEKDKILERDKVLKDAVDTQTKTLVKDLDQKWGRINKTFNDEISHGNKYKQQLQLREEKLKQALESSNVVDVFRTVEEESKKSNLNWKVNLKFDTLPTFKTREINLHAITSQHGTLYNKPETDVKNIKIQVIERYQTASVVCSLKCSDDGTVWICYFTDPRILKCIEKHEDQTLTTKNKFEICMQNIALTPKGDLLISVKEKSHLLVIPYQQQTIKKSQYNVSPLVTTNAIHVSTESIIVGAKDTGPMYPARGPRQIIVMDMQGKQKKIYEFDGNKRPLFTNPRRVTMDSMNIVYVLDRKCDDSSGRVVTINNNSGKIIIYNGNPKVNNQENPFTPGDLVITNCGNIVVSDRDNHLLHILNSNAECIKYINSEEYRIKRPWSLDIDHRGLLHIGDFCSAGPKLHVLKFTGF